MRTFARGSVPATRLGRWLREHYVSGADRRVVHFLAGRDPSQMARDAEYLRHVGRANLALIEAQRTDLAEQLTLAKAIRERTDRLAALVLRQQEQQEELARVRAEHASKLAALNSQLRAQRTQVSTLQQDERRMERLIAGLERVAREQQARRRAELERRRREGKGRRGGGCSPGKSGRLENPAVRERAKVDEPVIGRADEVAGPVPAGIAFDRLKGAAEGAVER